MPKIPIQPSPNALISEASPYLLQHAYNPVNWLPWSPEAFEKAKRESKLVLVSIGYSACHWCHVMEKESFENDSIAQFMNQHFICIKVDREEHPAIDELYMLAVQLMTQQGGWPLNCFTLPNGRAVYGGTYFNPKAWMQVLQNLALSYRDKPDEVKAYAEKLDQAINNSYRIAPFIPKSSTKTVDALDFYDLFMRLGESYDIDYGGHRGSPKFPMPVEWMASLDYVYFHKDKAVENHLQHTLNAMLSGAMFDHVEGGFARYSVDEAWKVPHFEKMLYDNAQLIQLYSNAYRHFKDPLYLESAERSAQFLTDNLLNHQSGGWMSALDADSDGEEGAYYVFTQEELKSSITKDLWHLAEEAYGLNDYAYWEEDKYLLCLSKTKAELREAFDLTAKQLQGKLESIQKALQNIRETRNKPATDDKEISGWNALACMAFCDLYKASANEKYSAYVSQSLRFFENHLLHKNGVKRYYKKGAKVIDGTLEDYSFWALAYLKSAEIEQAPERIAMAKKIVSLCDANFLQESALFYNSAAIGSSLVSNPVELADNVLPSANSVMAEVFHLLSNTGHFPEYEARLHQMLHHMRPMINDYPAAYFNWLRIFMLHSSSHHALVLSSVDIEDQKTLLFTYRPNVYMLPLHEANKDVEIFAEKHQENTVLYYLCTNKVCTQPVNQLHAIQELLP